MKTQYLTVPHSASQVFRGVGVFSELMLMVYGFTQKSNLRSFTMNIEIKEYEEYIDYCFTHRTFTGLPMFSEEEWIEQFQEYFLESYIINELKKK